MPALTELNTLTGLDLCQVGRSLGTIRRGQSVLDKGWAARTVHAAAPGSVGVHVVPLRRYGGDLRAKNTLALARIDDNIISTSFADSALLASLNDLLLVARADEQQSRSRRRSRVLGTARFSLDENSFLYRAVEADYELVRRAVTCGRALTGNMGTLVQPRTKGQGGEHPRAFAFYARRSFVAHMLGLSS